MEIEEVAERDPKAIHREPFDRVLGLQPFQARAVAYALGLDRRRRTRSASTSCRSWCAPTSTPTPSLAEINPLMVTKEGDVLALDCKMNFDDNALFRHKDIVEMRDLDEENPLEVEASKFGLNYIKLDGNIGCMVNGAGLAMATMDIIKLAGGEPANFLDVGGGATRSRSRTPSASCSRDPNVKAMLINIFGGIMRGDRIAEGVVEASQRDRAAGAGGGAARRDERRGGQADPGESALSAHRGREMGRRGGEGALPRLNRRGVVNGDLGGQRTRACSCRASPAGRERSTPSAAATTARRWSAA